MLPYLSVFMKRPALILERSRGWSYRSAALRFNSLAILLSRLNLPGTIFHEIGRLNPFFAALHNSQAFPMAALVHGRRPLELSTEKE